MKSKKVIGLTGSIATGKSFAANILRKMGFLVIDVDKIAHDLMKIGCPNYNNILGFFGEKILDDNKQIDRKKLADIVFASKKELDSLNKLTHDNIFHKINDIIVESKEELIFVEVPLLIELIKKDKMPIKFDEIWLVYVDKKTQIQRLINRNNYSLQEAEVRISSQMSVDLKKEYADFILYNHKDLEFLKKQIIERLEKTDENIC